MKNNICGILLLSVPSLLISTGSIAQEKRRNAIVFFVIDDWASTYLNEGRIFSKISYEGQLDKEIKFDLNPFLKEDGENTVVVEIINGQCNNCDGNTWLLGFEAFQDGESVDYVFEQGNSKGATVIMLSITYGGIFSHCLST